MKSKKKFKKDNVKIMFFNFKQKKIKSEIVISAIPGIAGLDPTLNIIEKLKIYLLLIKNQLFAAGFD